ncbi:MAG: hypothetical protein ACR2LL_12620 [Nitrosopumilus sp.]
MRRLGTIDLEILHLAIREKGSFNENHLENSELKRLGVGRILDSLASLKDRKMLSLNGDGSFSITKLAQDILWSNDIPVWAKILRLLQIKSCSIAQITDILRMPEEELTEEIEDLRKNQFILMSPQRQEERLVKIYEILPEGIERIDKTETEGFNDSFKAKGSKSEIEILGLIDEITKEIQSYELEQSKKDSTIKMINKLKDKLGI